MVDAHRLANRGRNSMRFIVHLRWALLVAAPFMFGLSSFAAACPLMWFVLVFFGASNLALHYINRRQTCGWYRWVWYATFAGDLLLVTMLVIARGGIRTDAYLLYVMVVTEAGILMTKRVAWAVGVLALAGYVGSVLWSNGPAELGRVAIRTVYLGLIALSTSYLAGSEKKALTDALTDAKTNLPNARLFQEALTEAVALHTRMDRPLSVAMIDVDNFRQLNGTIGHPMADHVLERLAETLVDWKQPGDIIARYGGEEFVVLLPDAGLVSATVSLERLRKRIAATPFELEGHPPVQVTISCGVSSLSVAHSASALLLMADRALLEAKAAGKNQVVAERGLQSARGNER